MYQALCLVALCAFTAVAGLAQTPTPGPTPPAFVLHGARGTGRVDGVLYGIAPGWHVQATPNGPLCTPVRGAASGPSTPIGLSARSMVRDGAPVVRFAATEPDALDCMILYRRGLVTERYELRPEGIEQSFVLAARPAGRGDLVVTCDLTTELAVATTAAGGLAFHHGEELVATLGGVTGVDRNGARMAGELRRVGNQVELRLPAAFVDGAAYPLVLDPLLSVPTLPTGSGDDREPDLAYDRQSNCWLLVWRRTISSSQSEVLALRLADDGTPLGVTFPIETGSLVVCSRPRVGNHDHRGTFVVAYSRGIGPFGQTDIQAVAVRANSGTLSGSLVVANSSDDETNACVGSSSCDRGTNFPDLMIAWDHVGVGVEARAVRVAATGALTTTGSIAAIAGSTSSHPALSSTGGASSDPHWFLAFEQVSAGDREVYLVVVDALAQAGSAPLAVTRNTSADDVEPAIDADGTQALLTWVRRTASDSGLWMVRASRAGGAVGLVGSEVLVADDLLASEQRPDVAFLGNGYAVAWEALRSLFDGDVLAQIVLASGELCGPPMVLAGPARAGNYTRQLRPQLGGRANASTPNQGGFIAFGEAQTQLGFDQDVVVQPIVVFGAGGPVAFTATTCGPAGTMAVNGPAALGNGGFAFTLAGADPAAAFALLSLGFSASTVACGTCALLPGLSLEFAGLVGGAATRPFPMPADSSFLGLPIVAQWLVFGANTAVCPLAPGLAGSAIATAVIGL